MFNNARISKIEGLVQQLDEDIDELDQEVESLAGLAHRVEETEVNLEAYRLAGLATAEAGALHNGLILFLYNKIRDLEAKVGELESARAVAGTVTGRWDRYTGRPID